MNSFWTRTTDTNKAGTQTRTGYEIGRGNNSDRTSIRPEHELETRTKPGHKFGRDMNSAWKRTRSEHGLQTRTRPGHKLGLDMKSAAATIRTGHQFGWDKNQRHGLARDTNSPWTQTRSGHELDRNTNSAWTKIRDKDQDGTRMTWTRFGRDTNSVLPFFLVTVTANPRFEVLFDKSTPDITGLYRSLIINSINPLAFHASSSLSTCAIIMVVLK